MSTQFFNWATTHWFFGFLVMLSLIQGTILLVNRVLRTIKVLFRGWPTAHLMDADGNIVHPKKER